MIKMFEKFNKPEIQKTYWDNGQKRYEVWWLNNKCHREDGPANQYWYENGQKEYEIWKLNGKEHREDGPSYQEWYRNGQKLSEQWFLNDKQYTREEWVDELKKIGSHHYDEQLLLLNMEKYNL